MCDFQAELGEADIEQNRDKFEDSIYSIHKYKRAYSYQFAALLVIKKIKTTAFIHCGSNLVRIYSGSVRGSS